MKLFGWEISLDLFPGAGRHGWVCCHTYRQADGKTLCFTACVPYVGHGSLTFYKKRCPPLPMMFVDVNGIVEVPARLGDKATDAVLDALIEMVEARHWCCGVGVSVHVEEDDDE